MQSRLCVIPARGGSKRIEKKNIRHFLGKPIIAYSIEAALECECFEEVMVSTDDPDIAQLAEKNGARVPFLRSEVTSGDNAGLAEVLIEVLQVYAHRGRNFDITACILATAPFITSTDLKAAMNQMTNSCCDGILSVCRFSYPIQRALVERRSGLRMKWPSYYRMRSQDLEPCYHDAGQFYIVRSKAVRHQRRLFLRRMLKYELPESQIQDIDTEDDWKLAEQKYNLLYG